MPIAIISDNSIALPEQTVFRVILLVIGEFISSGDHLVADLLDRPML